ncbi:MAG: hypothetical protein U0610_08835 [bacterium]
MPGATTSASSLLARGVAAVVEVVAAQRRLQVADLGLHAVMRASRMWRTVGTAIIVVNIASDRDRHQHFDEREAGAGRHAQANERGAEGKEVRADRVRRASHGSSFRAAWRRSRRDANQAIKLI